MVHPEASACWRGSQVGFTSHLRRGSSSVSKMLKPYHTVAGDAVEEDASLLVVEGKGR